MNKFVCLFIDKQAHVAQLVERILGKDEVGSSSLLVGSINLDEFKNCLTEIYQEVKEDG